MNNRYLVSLPERIVRAVAAGVGGLIYETTEVLLPGWLRQSRLYQAIVAALLRIAVELVGGVTDVLPPDDIGVEELAVRKTAGGVIELASFMAVGWSPLWLLAAAADLTGGTRIYLRALVSELQRDGVLPKDTEFTSVEELLNTLEGTSSLMAETIDVPPLNVHDMRSSWQSLQQNVAELPDASRLASIYAQLQQVTKQEGRSLKSMSSLIAAGAVRAGVQMGHTYIFDYYRDALRTITTEGLPAYAQRVAKPYLTVAASHLDPKRTTLTERLLQRVRRRAKTSDGEAS
ncbi:MAG: hypothetical protein E3J21_11325 [Anaerolineales bacterium]|nr:MAG: hypothetical protein E3J21_11325 [Anaerolineales bacterium]